MSGSWNERKLRDTAERTGLVSLMVPVYPEFDTVQNTQRITARVCVAHIPGISVIHARNDRPVVLSSIYMLAVDKRDEAMARE
jgi:hypothetical protein